MSASINTSADVLREVQRLHHAILQSCQKPRVSAGTISAQSKPPRGGARSAGPRKHGYTRNRRRYTRDQSFVSGDEEEEEEELQEARRRQTLATHSQPPDLDNVWSSLQLLLETIHNKATCDGNAIFTATESKDLLVTLSTTLLSAIRSAESPPQECLLRHCHIITALLHKHGIAFTSQVEIEPLVEVLLHTITSSTPTYLEALRALSFVVYGHGNLLIPMFSKLTQTLIPLADVRQLDKECQRLAINCLGNLCAKAGTKAANYYNSIFNAIYTSFSKYYTDALGSVSACRMLSSCLRALQFVILEGKTLHESHSGTLMGALSKLIFYGTSLAPVPTLDTSSDFHKMKDGSDSEYSGSDSHADSFSTWKVRLHALGCLQSIVRSSSSKFITYWPSVLPQRTQQPSVCSIVLMDPVHQVRTAACQLLSAIFDGQKSFLQVTTSSLQTDAQQSHSLQVKSYTPLSEKIGLIIKEVHNCLLHALDTETRATTIAQILKTCACVAANTPYAHFPPGIIPQIILRVRKVQSQFAINSEAGIPVHKSALSCLATLLSVNASNPEITALFNSSSASDTTSQTQFFSDLKHLARSALDSIKSPNTPSVLLPDLFRVLGAVSEAHYPTFSEMWTEVFEQVIRILETSKEAPCRVAALKVLEDATKSILKQCDVNKVVDSSGGDNDIELPHRRKPDTGAPLPVRSVGVTAFESVWADILSSKVTELPLRDQSTIARATLCNIFAQIPAAVFAHLKRATQLMCVTIMLGAARDEAPVVRAQACRALGIYILYNTLNTDPLFVTDVSLALIDAMHDVNLNVRIKASWSLANLCDSLVGVTEKSNGSEVITEEVPRETLLSIARSALDGARDNDKVRSNAVRALGYFMRFASGTLFAETDNTMDLFTSIIKTLIANTQESSAKVRWNACYALGNLFHNEMALTFSRSSVVAAMDALVVLVQTASNFKVRINACMALGVAPTRIYYGDRFIKIWETLIDALHTLDEHTDNAAAFHYRDTLFEQLIQTFVHLTLLIEIDDENAVRKVCAAKQDQIISAIVKFCDEVDRAQQWCHSSRQTATNIPQHSPKVMSYPPRFRDAVIVLDRFLRETNACEALSPIVNRQL